MFPFEWSVELFQHSEVALSHSLFAFNWTILVINLLSLSARFVLCSKDYSKLYGGQDLVVVAVVAFD